MIGGGKRNVVSIMAILIGAFLVGLFGLTENILGGIIVPVGLVVALFIVYKVANSEEKKLSQKGFTRSILGVLFFLVLLTLVFSGTCVLSESGMQVRKLFVK